ncbi:MAG: helix-turn-helix domain-containing protein, partial [Deferribacterota bacterium]|nr:helix-turn-helix domain-containing protein [Deferribacterota bacterium]
IIAKFGFKNIKMNNNAIEKLKSYDWPGNIRELENIVYRLCLLSKDKEINEHDLPVDLNSNPSNKINLSLPNDHLDLEELEKDIINSALEKFNGNKSKTAEYLRIPRHVLLYRLEKYKIQS